MKNRAILGLLLLLACPYFVQAKQLALIADKDNATSNVSAADLTKILNAQTKKWPDTRPITVVMRDPSTPDMQIVLKRLLNVSSDQERAFIDAHPNLIVVADSDDAVLRFVSAKRGAIGIVDLYSLTKDVNVVKVDGKLPMEPGYLLKGN